MNKNEIDQLKPVWVAMSDFFLDTELSDQHLRHIAKQISEAGLSQAEAKQVLMNDLFPALIFNLRSVAGEWAGFDEEWLYERILSTRNPNKLKQLNYKMDFWVVKDYWEKVTKYMESEPVV